MQPERYMTLPALLPPRLHALVVTEGMLPFPLLYHKRGKAVKRMKAPFLPKTAP